MQEWSTGKIFKKIRKEKKKKVKTKASLHQDSKESTAFR